MSDNSRSPALMAGIPVAGWLALALLSAGINTGLGLALSEYGVNTLGDFLLTFAATLAMILVLQSVLSLVFRAAQLVVGKGSGRFAFLAAAAAVLPLAILLPLASFWPEAMEAQGVLLVAMALLGSIWAAQVTYRLLARAVFADRPSTAKWLVFLPLMSTLMLAILWMFRVKVQLLSDQSGLPTWQAVLTMLGFLLSALAALLLARWLTDRYPPSIVLATVTAGALVLPPLIAAWPRESPTRSTLAADTDSVEHIILITVDTLRADALVPTGSSRPATPRFDAFFEDSLVFTNARSPSPWTKPSMASMLTGLPPLVHGATTRKSRLPDEVATIAEIFQQSGYATAGIGRNGSLGAGFNFGQGFQDFRFFPGGDITGNPAMGSWLLRALGLVRTNPTTYELADMASRWIEDHAESPFFLWLHFLDPHGPYAPPREVFPPGDPPRRIGRRFSGNGEVRSGFLVLDEDEKEWVRQLYAAEVRLVDQGVGQVLDTLERTGIYDNALIIFSSDHGEELFDHGMAGHGHTLYDEVIRVPLAIKFPGSSRTGSMDNSVSTEAVAATLLELSEVDATLVEQASKSLSHTWQADEQLMEATPPVVSTAFLYYRDQISIVFDGWKFIDRFGDSPDMLFSLDSDPREWFTLSGSHPEVVEQAQRIIDAYSQWVQVARQELGLASDEELELSPEALEDLRALGYIQ